MRGGELPPALKEAMKTNKKVSKVTGYKISPGLIKFVSKFRQEAKKTIKDEKDFMAVNKKTLELFNDHFAKQGKTKITAEIEAFAEEIKNSRGKKVIQAFAEEIKNSREKKVILVFP